MEIVGIIAFILAIIIGVKFLHAGVEVLGEFFDPSSKVFPYVAFILLFAGTLIAVSLLGRLLKKALDLTLLGSLDNVAGAVLGIVKWAFAISLVLWFMNTIGVNIPQEVKESSLLYPYVSVLAPFIINHLSVLVPYAEDLMKSMKALIEVKVP